MPHSSNPKARQAINKINQSKIWIGFFLWSLGDVAAARGAYGQAREHYAATLPLWRGLGIPPRVAEALCRLGDVAVRQQAYACAQRHYDEALDISATGGDRASRARVLRRLGQLAHARQRFARAQTFLREALRLFHRTGDRRGRIACQEDLARLAVASDQAARARTCWPPRRRSVTVRAGTAFPLSTMHIKTPWLSCALR